MIVVTTKGKVGDVQVSRKGGIVSIPEVVDDYNQSMNGCDKVDQMVNYYGHYQRKTTKWWKRIFYWLIEVAQINAFIIYKLSNDLPKLTLKEYKLAIVKQLLDKVAVADDCAEPRRSVGRPSSNPLERLQGNKHLVDYVSEDRNCVVCSTTVKRKRSQYICIGCSDRPHLCAKNCFRKYHTELNYK